MENKYDVNSFEFRMRFFTVRQLSELFGKSEDTIRRWKNEGIGKGEDNVRLEAVDNEDESGRRTSRHLIFTKSAVRDFVQANPFLMNDAPALRSFMQQEIKTPGVVALPVSIEECRSGFVREDTDEDWADDFDIDSHGGADADDSFPKSFFEMKSGEEDPVESFRRRLRMESFGEEEPTEYPRRRRAAAGEEHTRRAAIVYSMNLLHQRELKCRQEIDSAREAEIFFMSKDIFMDSHLDCGSYIDSLVRDRIRELEDELDSIRRSTEALIELLG